MGIHDSNPGIQKFRAARAKDRAIAIVRAEALKNNPKLSQKQAQQIAERNWELNGGK